MCMCAYSIHAQSLYINVCNSRITVVYMADTKISVCEIQGDRLSRFGFKTISSGSVTIELNIMQRSKEAETIYAEKHLHRKLE